MVKFKKIGDIIFGLSFMMAMIIIALICLLILFLLFLIPYEAIKYDNACLKKVAENICLEEGFKFKRLSPSPNIFHCQQGRVVDEIVMNFEKSEKEECKRW